MKRWFPLGAGAALILCGLVAGEMQKVREGATYRNFDVPSTQSGVHYLSPGVPDRAHEGAYTFTGAIHAAPLIAIGTVFVVFFLLRNFRALDLRLGLQRGLTQWLGFAAARLGVFRVAGAAPVARCAAGIFPFLNCQACEMATGACPMGQLQQGLMRKSVPFLAIGTIVATGALLGRWICGWLCPCGFFSDILDRVSLRRFKPSHLWRAGGFVALGFAVVASLVFAWSGITGQAPFCSTVCASGKVYGLLPYYATTAAGEVATLGASGGLPVFVFHAALFALWLLLAVLISGRVFCRYLCPLGALLGLANRFAFVRITHHAEACNGCGKCTKKCPMDIDLADPRFLTQTSCIRCGRCVALCTRGARQWDLPWAPAAARSPSHVNA